MVGAARRPGHVTADGQTAVVDVDAWVSARLPSEVVHLDAAAAGRPSAAVLDEEVAHLRREAQTGAYVAEVQAQQALDAGRAAVGALLGLGGDDVALPSNAADAFAAVLAAWPLPAGSRVGSVASEYGPNAAVLARLAAERGWRVVPLPVDGLGRVVDVPAGLDLLALPQVASQRGVNQPVAALRDSGVPVLLDVAQSLGQTDVPAGCAAYVGTSRKWLCGPRGVGLLAVDPAWAPLLRPPPGAAGHLAGVRRWDAAEAHVAGRVGLGRAVQEWTPDLLPVVAARAATARQLLAQTPWRVVEPVDEPTGITTLVPPPGADVAATRAALLAQGLLTSAVPAERAADLAGPVLRVSTAAYVQPDDLAALAAALAPAQAGRPAPAR